MRLWQPRLNNIVVSRFVESESPESYVLHRSRSTLFRFDKVGIANRSRFFRFGEAGNWILYCIWRLLFTLNCLILAFISIFILLTRRNAIKALYIGKQLSNHLDLFPEMLRDYCPIEIFEFAFWFIEI